MPVTVLIGAQWGDEGKGKIIDALAPGLQMVVRYQGGPNAGHTVIADGRRIVLHQVPTGILHTSVSCLISPGVLLDPWELLDELAMLAAQGVDLDRLRVSPSCHLIMPWHRRLDRAREAALDSTGGAIGTTGRGMGPCAMDKAGRRGVRLGDLLDPARRGQVAAGLERANAELATLGAEPLPRAEVDAACAQAALGLAPFVADTQVLLHEVLQRGGRVLMEGAQGAMLDLDWGTYPYVTSTHPSAGGACTGGGVPLRQIDQVIGICKVYATRVGNGPFPTEFPPGPFADAFRTQAGEFGATTGRPRRCGWFDAVAARYACRLNGFTELALTKLDVLDGQEEVRAAVAYELEGRRHDEMPEDLRRLESGVTPVWQGFPGWTDSAAAGAWDELPSPARRYLAWLEEDLATPIGWVSNGPDRRQLIRRPGA
ncbi:MAG: adenylosuccinate synthase [bacterium]|jgi:adenylosuccinate synthase|nr:adenylosuccinate synthase [bacterium]